MIEIFTPLRYTSGYKYQNAEDFDCYIPALKKFGIVEYDFIRLEYGYLTILKGYAWDGASGPTFDTKSSMRGGMIHDAIYLLIRQGLLAKEAKHIADEILRFVCERDGMWKWRAGAWYIAVDKLADAAADPKNKKKVYVVAGNED